MESLVGVRIAGDGTVASDYLLSERQRQEEGRMLDAKLIGLYLDANPEEVIETLSEEECSRWADEAVRFIV
jgi:hypothetical protein